MNKLIGIFIVMGVLLLGACTTSQPTITNFEECVAAGYGTMESYPPKCSVNGQTFTQELPESQKPTVCTMEYAPVCGVDGATYGNECMAQDIEIAYRGECGEENAFKNSRMCTKEYMPVCGADGVTYSNRCMAGNMTIAYEGTCRGDE